MITHANIMWTIRSSASMFQIHEGERLLSFLPLSHIAERMMSDFAPDRRRRRDVVRSQPGHRGRGPPRLPPDGVLRRASGVGEVPGGGRWPSSARSTALKKLLIDQLPRPGSARSSSKYGSVDRAAVWEQLPYEAARRRGRRARSATSSASTKRTSSSPRPRRSTPTCIRWFHAIGLPIVELYGQTEACGPTTCNPPEANRIGTVGRPIPGVRVRIADDGEILVKGGNVCSGYFRDDAGHGRADRRGRLDALRRRRQPRRRRLPAASPAARRTSSSPRPARTSRRRRSRPTSATTSSSRRRSSIGEGRRYLTALLDARRRRARRRGPSATPRSPTTKH